MKTRKYEACIFDLDGTLADTLNSIAYFGNGTLKAFNLPGIPTQEYRKLVGNGADVLMDRMLSFVGAKLDADKRQEFRREYDKRYEADPMKLVTPYPGLPQMLKKLKGEGLALGVLSNKPDNMTRFVAEGLYPGVMTRIQGQRQGVPKKPDPKALLTMAEELGIPARKVLYIGDSGVDMETGTNAGMDTCGVLWGFRDREELISHGAKYLAASAQELEKLALKTE